MDNNGIDRKKLFDAIGKISADGKLKKAVAEKNFNDILASLDPAQAQQLKSLMADKKATDKLLASREAQAILKALQNDGKR